MKKAILFSFLAIIGLYASPFERSSGNIFNKNAAPMQEQMVSKEVKEQMRQNDLKFQKLKECDRFQDELKYKECISGVQAHSHSNKNLSKLGKIGKDDENFAIGFYENLPKPEININKIERMQGKNTLTEEQVKKIERDGKKALAQ